MVENAVDYREDFSPEMKEAVGEFETVESLAEGYIGLKKTAGQDYREGFEPETKTALEKFDSPAKLAEGYIALEKDASRMRNEKGITVPADGATAEDVSAFHKAIGVPELPDGYELPKPEFPEGMTYNEDRATKFSALAHSLGIPKVAFQGLVNAFNEDQIAEFNAFTKDGNDFKEKTTAEMKKEWGNDYGANLAQADAVIEPIFGKEFKQVLTDTGFNNHPAVIRGMLKVAQAVGEHTFVKDRTQDGGTGALTHAALTAMTNDPRYWDPSRRDNDYVKKVEQYSKDLAEQTNPGANS